jgi:hypothetical protein
MSSEVNKTIAVINRDDEGNGKAALKLPISYLLSILGIPSRFELQTMSIEDCQLILTFQQEQPVEKAHYRWNWHVLQETEGHSRTDFDEYIDQ